VTAPLVRVDLSPLASYTNLRAVLVASARLEALDLGPLAKLPLTTLAVGGERLATCDLKPLESMRNLRTLNLGGSDFFADLDLRPLAGLSSLDTLRVSVKVLGALDLAPLAALPNLRDLYLGAPADDSSSPDLRGLIGCPVLDRLMIAGERLGPLDLAPVGGLPISWLNLVVYGASNFAPPPYPPSPLDLRPLANCLRLSTLVIGERPLTLPEGSPRWAPRHR
jgi:hypothetical protein